jgi:rieske iron-sulfur protein
MCRADDQSGKSVSPLSDEERQEAPPLSRRSVLKAALSLGLTISFLGQEAGAQQDVKKVRPQVGDVFVFAAGDRQGQAIALQDVPLGGPPVTVYPMEPQSKTIRDGSRLNQVLLIRLASEELSDQTRTAAAEGIIAYSAVCTHTGCNVAGWKADTKQLVCPCHASTFDPKDRARVVGGPAPKALAVLPLRLTDGQLTVAAPFSARVGAEQK